MDFGGILRNVPRRIIIARGIARDSGCGLAEDSFHSGNHRSGDSMISQLLLVLHSKAMMVGNLECLGFYSAHVTHPCPQFRISSQSSVDSASNKAVTIVFDNDFTLDGYRV